MKEEKTQGIDTETTAKDRHNTDKKAKETELLDLRAGYCQHTSPDFPNTTLILNVLEQMKNNNRSEYTIKFFAEGTRKALTILSKQTFVSFLKSVIE